MALIDAILVDGAPVSKNNLRQYLGDREVIATATTKTVGSGGDFATLSDAFAWASQHRFVGPLGSLTISLLAGNHTLSSYKFDHPDGSRISIQGQALTGAVPVVTDMTGVESTDRALIEGRFPSRIILSGSGTYGLSLPHGLSSVTRVAMIIPKVSGNAGCRYGLAIGAFSSSHQTAEGLACIGIGEFAIYGGVWGILGNCANIVFNQKVFAGGQTGDGSTAAGAPIGLFNSRLKADAGASINRVELYAPGCQYGLYADEDSLVLADNALRIKGPQVHIKCKDSRVLANSAALVDGSAAVHAEGTSRVNLAYSTMTGLNTTTASGQSCQIWDGNNALRSVVGIASGAVVNINGAAVQSCLGNYCGYVGMGGVLTGLGVTVTDCDWDTACVAVAGGKAHLEITLTSPRAGSINTMVATNGGYIQRGGSSGLTYSPNLTQSADFSVIV